jgi:hypothetical protein
MSNTPAFITGPFVTEHKLEMTLRDYFAANAMQSLIVVYNDNKNFVDGYARRAFEIADAMMKARTA